MVPSSFFGVTSHIEKIITKRSDRATDALTTNRTLQELLFCVEEQTASKRNFKLPALLCKTETVSRKYTKLPSGALRILIG